MTAWDSVHSPTPPGNFFLSPTRPTWAIQTIARAVKTHFGPKAEFPNPKYLATTWEIVRLAQVGWVGGTGKNSWAIGRVAGDCLTRPIAQETFF